LISKQQTQLELVISLDVFKTSSKKITEGKIIKLLVVELLTCGRWSVWG